MAGLLEYAQQEQKTFREKPFSSEDSLLLAQLCYLRFEHLPREFMEEKHSLQEFYREEFFSPLLTPVRAPEENKLLLFRVCASRRFREIRLFHPVSRFINEADGGEEQFFGITMLLPDGSNYLAFRGTDATVVGWKEDLNMAFLSPVPSQTESVKYLHEVASLIPGRLRLGGHSKGGNLAVYASVNADEKEKERIEQIFSHDGPGFTPAVLQDKRFASVSSKINKTLPQSSLVGMLLQTQENYHIVRSKRFWVMQHDPFSWEIENGCFVQLQDLTSGAAYMSETLNCWLQGLTVDQRRDFVDNLFNVMDACGVETVQELTEGSLKEIMVRLSGLRGVDKETVQQIKMTLRSLAALYVKSMKTHLLPAKEE